MAPKKEGKSEENERGDDYNPFANREVVKPTTDLETLMHLLKGSLGGGVMAIPYAFKNSGLSAGVFLTMFTGFLCTYCVHLLVANCHKLLFRNKVSKYSYNEVFQESLLVGPDYCKKCSRWGSLLVDLFLCIDLYGCCVIYAVSVAKNIKQVADLEKKIDLRLYMVVIYPLLMALGCVKHLKYLAPLSAIANIMMLACMGILWYYVATDFHDPAKLQQFTSIIQIPVFFGVCIFALEGIGVVLPLENQMKNPQHFIGCISVLNIGMTLVVLLYTVTGFFGYLRFGDACDGNITLNLPRDEWGGMVAKVLMAFAITITYGLQFYVPFEITWKLLKDKKWFASNPGWKEYFCRIIAVTITVIIAIIVPNIGEVIALVGALCLSFLGLIFPCIIDSCVRYDSTGLGKCYWILFKNIAIIIFGIIGCISGVYVSFLGIIHDFSKLDYDFVDI